MSLKKKKIIIMTAVITILFVITAVAVSFIIDVNIYKERIETALSDSLGMDVRVRGKMKVSIFPDVRVSLKNIYVSSKGTDCCVVDEVKVYLKVLPLIRGEVRVKGIGLETPTFNLVKNKQGMFNFVLPGKSSSTALPPVKKVYVSKGNIIYLDEQTNDKIMVRGINLSLANISTGNNSGQNIRKISFNGELNVKILKAKDYEVSDLSFHIKAKNDVIELHSVSESDKRDKGKSSITIDLTENIPHFTIQYIGSGLPAEEVLQKLSQKEILTGKINLTVNLSMKGKNLLDTKKTLNGDVLITGENLVFHGIDIDEFIYKFDKSKRFNLFDVGAYFFVGPFGPIITKGTEFASIYSSLQKEEDSAIRKLICLWKINNGVADAKDVALSTEENRIAMKGKLDFVNERFLDVTLAVLDNRGCAVLIQEMHGSFSSPEIERISTVEAALGPVLSVLKKTKEALLGKEKCAAFYTGSLGHPN